VVSRFEALERDRPDRDPRQGHDLVAELGQHPPNFAILPFREHHLQQGGLSLAAGLTNPLGPGLPLGEPDPILELPQVLLVGLPGDQDAVDLLDAIARVCQAIGEVAVVGQQDQPGAVLVQSADREDALSDSGKQIDHPGTPRRIGVGRDVASRLVDGEVNQSFLANRLTIDGDLVAIGIHPGSEFPSDLTVDGHPSLKDQFLTGSA
jgi:hypothetical protein